MIVADTNVVSEFMRATPEPAVMSWAASVPAGELWISAVTVQEIEFGIALLRPGQRQRALREAWAAIVGTFDSVVCSYDQAAASATAEILAQAQHRGARMSLSDAQIAGICVSRGATLATRNVTDFDGAEGLLLVNPWN